MNLPHSWTAVSALALIRADPGVEASYRAQYRGADDALVALSLVAAAEMWIETDAAAASEAAGSESVSVSDVDPADATALRRLQDLIYGRPARSLEGAAREERELAARRLAAISANEHRRSADVYAALGRLRDTLGDSQLETAHAPDATDATNSSDAPKTLDAPDSPESPALAHSRFPPRFLLIATLVAGIIIGIGMGLASTLGHEAPVAAPTASFLAAVSAPSDLLILTRFPGNLTAADLWFARTQTEEDVFNGLIVLENERVDSSESRFAGTTASGWRLWVVRTPSRGFCLIGQLEPTPDADVTTRRACVSRVEFNESSVRVELDTTTVLWNGRAILTSIRW